MNIEKSQKQLNIGILGMPDSPVTTSLIQSILSNNISIDFVIFWKPSYRDQYRRFKRKLRFDGIIPTISRTYYAVFKSKQKIIKNSYQNLRKYYVTNHNSLECQNILKKEKVDLLLLATDAIIYKRILKIPSLATLNAHPGWIPQFRGLGSVEFQLKKGYFPAVSVHKVDEGVDTGPLILRQHLQIDPRIGIDRIGEKIIAFQEILFCKVIKLFQTKKVKYIDTFHEPSNMTRGISLKDKRSLDKKLKQGEIKLKSIKHISL